MTFDELYNLKSENIDIMTAAACNYDWNALTEDSKARIRGAIQESISVLDGGRGELVGIGIKAAEILQELRNYKAPAKINVQVEAPLPEKAAPKPIKRGNK